MASHLNVTSGTFGLTLPSGTEVESTDSTYTLGVVSFVGASGEYTIATAEKSAKREITITGVGPAGFTGITSGTLTPSSIKLISAEQSESNKAHPRFTIKGVSHHDNTNDGASATSAGAAPTKADLEIVSVEYASTETYRATVAVEDVPLITNDGTVELRATCKRKGTYSLAGRGDLPSGLAIGAGLAANGMATGKSIITKLGETEKQGEWNGWSADGEWYPAAT